jgi:hypothetical protein
MLQFLHQRDLTDCGRGCAFFRIEVDFLQRYQLSRLSVSAFENLGKSAKSSNFGSKIRRARSYLYSLPPHSSQAHHHVIASKRTVAYVPSPSFSSCWNELGCLLSMAAVGSSLPRFCRLIVLGTETESRCNLGEGGNVRKGGRGEGRSRDVNLGSKSREAGVMILSRIANVAFDPYNEAVVRSGGGASRKGVEQARG